MTESWQDRIIYVGYADNFQVARIAGRKAEGARRKARGACRKALDDLRLPLCALSPAPLRFMILSCHDSVG